ncbi:hypothetical protein JW859_00830 [bacterium]|nr:hypothetical protein [bacterium]
MHRITIAMILMLAAFLASCGGGGTTAPDLENNDDSTVVADELNVIGPSEVIGSHSTSVLEDQLNVLTGADETALNAQLAKFGITVISKSGGWANVQLPAGMDLDWAITELEKEYNIATAEKVNVLSTPRISYSEEVSKSSSFLPFDPMYMYTYVAPEFSTDSLVLTSSNHLGQAYGMAPSNFQGAFDVSTSPGVAGREVRIAVIDAGFFDYEVYTRSDFGGAVDDQVSGSIAADGTATTGLAAAGWDIYDDGDPDTTNYPYRMTGELILGMLADDIGDPSIPNGYHIYVYDFDASTTTEEEEFWNEGITGINPNATYILLKTGQAAGDTWSFNDNQIAAAISYAAGSSADTNGGLWPNGGCEADIIILGMFSEGAVGANVSTAIQGARDNNALVIAPAGDVIDSLITDENGFVGWGEMPVDITVTDVTPASDPNCIAVSGTGFNRSGDLGTITYNEETYDNLGIGWSNQWFGEPFEFTYREIPDYCNTGGDIAAVGYGIGWSARPYFISGTGEILPGYSYRLTYDSWGSVYAAAYVAGAASIVHQALHEANNAEPSDDDVWQVLQDTWQFDPITGLAGAAGLLDAGRAAFHAMEGGHLFQPSMYLQNITVSQPLSYTEIDTDFEITPTVMLGTAPFTIRVDWDNGAGEVEEAWTNGDPVTLTGGWDTLGQKGVNIEIEDADGQLDTFALWVHVVAPLGAGITVTDSNGTDWTGFEMDAGNYRLNANPTNVYTGEIDGTPNVTTFSWDFSFDGATFNVDATGTAPSTTFDADVTIALLVEESVRPDRIFTLDINVK